MHWNSIFNFIVATFCMCLCANAAPLGNECSGRYSDADRQNHVEVKCAEINLTSYRVADYHYCCGCTAGQFVAEDCGCRNHYSSVCRTCPANSFASSANVQKECTVSKPSSYCDTLQFTRYVEGNSTADARCECVDGSYALNSMINGCRKHSAACAKDFIISDRGNKTHDIQCQPCPTGHCTSGYEAAVKCSPLSCNRTTNASGGEVIPPDWPKPPDPPAKTPASTSAGPELIPGPLTLAPRLGTPAWIGICVGLVVVAVALTILVFRRLNQKQSKGTCLTRLLGHQSSSGDEYPLNNLGGTPSYVAVPEDQVDGGKADPGAAAPPPPNDGNGTPRPRKAGAEGDSVSSGQDPYIIDSGNNSSYVSEGSNPSLEIGQHIPLLHDEHQRHQDHKSHLKPPAESPPAEASADPARTEQSPMKGDVRRVDADDESRHELHFTENPPAEASADPAKTVESPMKGCVRRVAPESYMPLFAEQGYRKVYEPDEGPNCLCESVVKNSHRDWTQAQVVQEAIRLRERACRYIAENRERFGIETRRKHLSLDEYIEKIKSGGLPCGEVMAHAIALCEGCTVTLVNTDGAGSFLGNSPEMVYIGHVEDNYYLLLDKMCHGQGMDRNASCNRTSVSDLRVESTGRDYVSNAATSSNESAKGFENGCGPAQSAQDHHSTAGSLDLSHIPLPAYCECLKEDDRRKVRELINKYPELQSISSELIQDTELAKQILEGSNSLPDKATSLAEKSLLDVKAFFKNSGMVKSWRVELDDWESRWSPQDPNGLKDKLISLVINEQGSKLTVEKLIESVPRNPSLYRLFCDNFIACLEMKCKEM